MALTRLPRMASSTPDLTRAIDLVKKAVDPLLQQTFANGVLVEDLAVTAATAFLATHNLGRVPAGYVVTSVTASAQLLVRPTTYSPSPNPLTQLALLPSATGTLSLWIF